MSLLGYDTCHQIFRARYFGRAEGYFKRAMEYVSRSVENLTRIVEYPQFQIILTDLVINFVALGVTQITDYYLVIEGTMKISEYLGTLYLIISY